MTGVWWRSAAFFCVQQTPRKHSLFFIAKTVHTASAVICAFPAKERTVSAF